VVHDGAPRLEIALGGLPDGGSPSFLFSVYADPQLQQLVAQSPVIRADDEIVGWGVPAGTLGENATYWWTARQGDDIDQGEPAAPESFTVDAVPEAPAAPHIRAPEDGDQVASARPEIVIDPTRDPDPEDQVMFHCEVFPAGDPAHVAAFVDGTAGADGGARLRLNTDLDEDGRYQVHCRALDRGGLASDWSAAPTFTVNADNAPPAAPMIVWPAPDSTVADAKPTLFVRAGADPEGEPTTLQFRVSTDPTFPVGRTMQSPELSPGSGGRVQWQVPEALPENAVVFWSVRGRDPHGAGPAATARFTVNAVDEAPSVPRPLNPALGSTSEPSPRFLWGAAIDPEGTTVAYEVAVYADFESTQRRWHTVTPQQFADYPGQLRNGAWWWRVRAIDGTGQASPWTMPIPFRVQATGQGSHGSLGGGRPVFRSNKTPRLEPIPGWNRGPLPHGFQMQQDRLSASEPADDASGEGCDISAAANAPAAPGFLLVGLLALLRRRR
jgi:MYXO-CTERM domain-containing protein